MRLTRSFVFAAVLAAALPAALVAESQSPSSNPKPKAEPMSAQAAPATLGKLETAKWTATTYEAATAEAHKKVLASGRPAAVTGEVVDVSCYLQLGKRGEAHVPCGTKCITNGQPIGLVDVRDSLYLLFAEEHHPRRDGGVDLKSVFLPWLAKTVTVTGVMVEMRGYRALFVQAAELGGAVKAGETK
jgi:hypothetical protein